MQEMSAATATHAVALMSSHHDARTRVAATPARPPRGRLFGVAFVPFGAFFNVGLLRRKKQGVTF